MKVKSKRADTKTDKTAKSKHEAHFTEERFYKSWLEAVIKNLRIHEKNHPPCL